MRIDKPLWEYYKESPLDKEFLYRWGIEWIAREERTSPMVISAILTRPHFPFLKYKGRLYVETAKIYRKYRNLKEATTK